MVVLTLIKISKFSKIKAIKLKGLGRIARKQKHVAKRKGKFNKRTGRPGKSK